MNSALLTTFLACSVCFGDPDSLMSKGVAAGVLSLGAIIVGVLAAIAYTSISWARRAKELHDKAKDNPSE